MATFAIVSQKHYQEWLTQSSTNISESQDGRGELNDDDHVFDGDLMIGKVNCQQLTQSLNKIGRENGTEIAESQQVHDGFVKYQDEGKLFVVLGSRSKLFEWDQFTCFQFRPAGAVELDLCTTSHVPSETREMVVLRLPCCTSFMDSFELQEQFGMAWRLARALRRVGFVRTMEFSKEKDTLVEICLNAHFKNDTPVMVPNTTTNVSATSTKGRSGWKSDTKKIKNKEKCSTLKDWVIDTFGKDVLCEGAGILDVAGGKGELAFKLLNYADIPTTIVDPRPLDLANMLRHLSKDHVRRLMSRDDQRNDDCSVTVPIPGHIRCWFWYPLRSLDAKFLVNRNKQQEQAGDQTMMYAGREMMTTHESELERLEAILPSCSMLLGLHPDQATEAIVDWGLHLKKPFVTIPCCVFPNLFPHRHNVRTHEQFCKYLMDKDENMEMGHLNVPGRNTIIYRK